MTNWALDLNTLFSQASKPASKDTGTLNEMESYLSEQPLLDSDVDILSQWRSIESVYPTVAWMAWDLLAVFLLVFLLNVNSTLAVTPAHIDVESFKVELSARL